MLHFLYFGMALKFFWSHLRFRTYDKKNRTFRPSLVHWCKRVVVCFQETLKDWTVDKLSDGQHRQQGCSWTEILLWSPISFCSHWPPTVCAFVVITGWNGEKMARKLRNFLVKLEDRMLWFKESAPPTISELSCNSSSQNHCSPHRRWWPDKLELSEISKMLNKTVNRTECQAKKSAFRVTVLKCVQEFDNHGRMRFGSSQQSWVISFPKGSFNHCHQSKSANQKVIYFFSSLF